MKKHIKTSAFPWLTEKVNFQNTKWYVWVALFASIIQILTTTIQVYTLMVVQETRNDVKNYIKGAYNEQSTISTIGMDGSEFLKQYFGSLEKQDYGTACGFESRRRCIKSDMQSLIQYAEDKRRVWFTKWEDGEHLKDAWKPKNQPDSPNLETWCVKTSYAMKSETSPIEQIARYDILTRPTGEKEVASVLCEKTFKNNEERTRQMGCGQSNVCN